MGFGALRAIIRPLSRTLIYRTFPSSNTSAALVSSPFPKSEFRFVINGLFQYQSSCSTPTSSFYHSLTDTRLPKRRPVDKPRRKRASIRPRGPYAWVKHVEGEPVLPSQPNEGSVKSRNEKKRMRLRRAFTLAEAKKRKAQLQEAKRKKNIKKVERKMAAVARDRAWTQRLSELQQLEEEKKKAMA